MLTQSSSTLKQSTLSACQNSFWKVSSWYLSLLNQNTVNIKQKLETKCRWSIPSLLVTAKLHLLIRHLLLTFPLCLPSSSSFVSSDPLECCWRHTTRKKRERKRKEQRALLQWNGWRSAQKKKKVHIPNSVPGTQTRLKSIMPRLSPFWNPIQLFKWKICNETYERIKKA